MSTSTPQWDEWFSFEKETCKQPTVSEECECDSCIEDSYEEDSSQIESPPLTSDGFSSK